MKVKGCVGTGSFGTVLKVQMSGQMYALKKIQLQFDCQQESEQIQMVRKQAQLLSNCLYHPNIVRYYSSFRRGDHFYILMQYAGYRCLDDLIMPFSNTRQIANLIIQVSLALRHLKKNAIIHRDIKPSNILVSDKGLLKIADFGISRKLQTISRAESCLGTPYYTAPQIVNQQKYDYAVDIWSFGVVLYEAIHGILPFRANNIDQLRHKIRQQFPKINSDIHPDLASILKGCLIKNPHYRLTVEQILTVPLIKQQMKEELHRSVKYF